MWDRNRESEPLCETSEKNERLFSKDEILPIGLEIGRRITELFGYQKLSNIVFRLKSNSHEIDAVVNHGALPSAELLLCIRKATGASIDWLLTGEGEKFSPAHLSPNLPFEGVSSPVWFQENEATQSLVLQ